MRAPAVGRAHRPVHRLRTPAPPQAEPCLACFDLCQRQWTDSHPLPRDPVASVQRSAAGDAGAPGRRPQPHARLRQAVRRHHWTVGVKFTEPLPRPSVPRVPASAWRTEGKVKASSAREMRLTKARMRQSSRQGRRFRHGHLQGSDTRTDANYSPVACDVTSRGFASAAATQSPALKLACAIPGGAAPRADDLCSRLRGRASRCGGWGSSVHASEPVPTPSRCPRPGCPRLPSGIVRRAGAGSQRRHTGAFARRECASERATRVTLACARRAPGRGRVLRAEPRDADAHSRRPPPSSPIGFSGAPRTHGTMAQPGVRPGPMRKTAAGRAAHLNALPLAWARTRRRPVPKRQRTVMSPWFCPRRLSQITADPTASRGRSTRPT
jgi:hypothetical protein